MSADAWRVCPKCKNECLDERKEKVALAERAAEKAYGVVPPEQYISLKTKADLIKQDDWVTTETFREDYEIYTDEDGMFVVSYSGKCEKCGFAVLFKHSEKKL